MPVVGTVVEANIDATEGIVVKENISTKVGISFASSHNGDLLIKNLSGLFASTRLEVADKVIMIEVNGVGLYAEDLDPHQAAAAIRDAEGRIVVKATSHHHQVRPKIFICEKQTCCAVASLTVPKVLADAGVSLDKWNRIVNEVQFGLVEHVSKVLSLCREEPYVRKSSNNRKTTIEKSMKKCMMGKKHGVDISKLGLFVDTADETYMSYINAALSVAHSNTSMAAANILSKVTALLVPHGIMTELITQKRIPWGHDFKIRIQDYEVQSFELPFHKFELSLPLGLEFSRV